ncbi:protein GOLVEN 2 isoform X1 [Diospyros lotus]|uniref:protein GOLVEN 2 isoform X1 n=1 Tax=Diospyros lotus TaxID=55363 RepID=UPI00225B50C8|nr:protein GOLVEN 2 isoform X1 [Diospyros lotus]
MALLVCKRLLLLAFLMLCIISVPATAARVLRTDERTNIGAEKGQNDAIMPKGKWVADSEELLTMDYTPAKKKPPIHN